MWVEGKGGIGEALVGVWGNGTGGRAVGCGGGVIFKRKFNIETSREVGYTLKNAKGQNS